MSAITTHVLDISRGRPAAGVRVLLEIQAGKEGRAGQNARAGKNVAGKDVWEQVSSGATDADGRLSDLTPKGAPAEAGVYRLTFHTGAYFQAQNIETFHPFVMVVFAVKKKDAHYHVPLLLSPFGYSTYRGS